MQLLSIGRYIEIPVEKGVQMRDKARDMVIPQSLKEINGKPVYLGQVGKLPEGEAKKKFLQEIAMGRYYWEFFDIANMKCEVVGDTMAAYYRGANGVRYGLALVTNEKEILRRMDVRR